MSPNCWTHGACEQTDCRHIVLLHPSMDLQVPLAFFRDPLGRLDLCHTCVSCSTTKVTNDLVAGRQGSHRFEMHNRKDSLFPDNMRWVYQAYQPCCVLLPACCNDVICVAEGKWKVHGR